MKNLFKNFLVFFLLFFISSCDKENTEVTGKLLKGPSPVQVTTNTLPTGFFYGNHFSIQNSSLYENLLEVCRRCGTRRIITDPFGGGTTYQRFWVLGDSPKKCRNWNNQGYIQIEFAERRLPTSVKVLIQPRYTGRSAYAMEWGEPFEISATANPINENQGFQISVNPSEGLGGVYSLIIRSEYSNHVNNSELDVNVTYGQGDLQTIIGESLKSLTGEAVKDPAFDCGTYTN